MPEPMQTPVRSRDGGKVGCQAEEVRASSAAARAYWVNFAVLWASCLERWLVQCFATV